MFGATLSFTIKETSVVALPILIAVFVGLFIIIPSSLFRKWYFYRRRLKKNIITAEYEPPLGLNPAEIGYLFDGKLREQEVGAMIISLVQRGLLHVKKLDGKKLIFAGPRIDDSVKTYEKKLIDEADTVDGVSAEQLLGRFTTRTSIGKKTVTFGSKEFLFSRLVHEDLRKRHYIKGSFLMPFIYTSFKITLLLEFVLIVIPTGILYVLASLQTGTFNLEMTLTALMLALALCVFSLVPLFIASMILAIIRGRIIGRDWIITETLERLWPQLVGFRQYIQLVEADKLAFHSSNLETSSKNDILPYAVALGYVKNWRNIIG